MGRKKIVTTTSEEIDPAAQLAAQPLLEDSQASDQENELLEYLENLGGNANVVKIYKMVDGQNAYCGSSEPGAISEDLILKRWGGGRYRLVGTLNGRWVRGLSKMITLYSPPEILAGASPSPSNDSGSSGRFDAEISLLRDQIQRQQEMLLKMMEGKQNGTNLAEVFSIVRDMQTLAPRQPDISALLPSIVDLFSKTMEAARESAGGDNTMSWLKIAAGAVEKLPAIVGALAASKAAQPGGAGVSIALTPEQQAIELLRMGLGWLKKKAAAGKSVERIVDMLADNIDDETFGPVAVAILNSPFENIGKVDPEIMQEPMRTWFYSLYNELRKVMYENADTPTGAGGGGTDLAGNEKIDD